jgi:flagella synthesis protein FlgN
MNTVESLLNCILEEDALIIEFTDLLRAESAALTERKSFETLQAITESKNQFAGRLQALSDRRDGLLAELGLSAGHEGTGAAAALHAELSEPWATLLANSAAAAKINERNGVLIDVHLRYTEEALGALRKLTTASNLYDASGRSRGAGGAKRFVAR